MSAICPADSAGDQSDRGGGALARGAAHWLSLAAAPTFLLMAFVTAGLGGGAEAVCSAEHGSLMSGMIPMYLLMGAFHSGPWLKMISGLPRGALRRCEEGSDEAIEGS